MGLEDVGQRGRLAVLNPPPIEEWEQRELGERLRIANRMLRKLYTERGELQRRVSELEELLDRSRSA